MEENHIQLLHHAFKPLDLSTADHAEFFEKWEEVSYKRYDFITCAGDIERYFYVVVEGVQCVYLIDRNGDKQVIGFSFDGSFSGIYDAFMKAKASSYFLEALTPSKLLRINLPDFLSLFKQYPEFEHWGRVVHLDLLIGRVDREVELITTTAQERFSQFNDRCPEPLKNIPQKYLASYLNMTPETFSRLRKAAVSKS